MRVRAGWGVVAAVMAAAMGVGCGRENRDEPLQVPGQGDSFEPQTPTDVAVPTPPESRPPESKPPESTPPADSSAPPPVPVVDTKDEPTPAPEAPHPEGWWQHVPEAGPVTFEVPACIPMAVATTPRFAQACSVKEFLADGRLAHLRRFDAQGHLLEDTRFQANGTPASSTRSTYAQGREVRREVRDTQSTRITEQRYDDTGRLVHTRVFFGWTPNAPGLQSESRYLYDAQGRLEREQDYKTLSDGTEEVTLQYRYLYGQTGKLEAIQTSDLGIAWFPRESFTYHPNGQLARWSLQGYSPTPYGARKEYDEQGHLIFSSSSLDESGSGTTYAYDARGFRVEMHEVSGSSRRQSDRLTRYLYDEAGRLGAERFTEDTDSAPGWPEPPYSLHVREVKRSFYSCGGDLLFEELDTNENAVRDGSHVLVRDAAGNLRVELFLGTFARPWWEPVVRIEYGYDGCHE